MMKKKKVDQMMKSEVSKSEWDIDGSAAQFSFTNEYLSPFHVVNLGVARSKSESKEDKKARKAALKEQKRSRRTEKKATKEAFKNEEAKQINTLQNQRVNKGVKHIA